MMVCFRVRTKKTEESVGLFQLNLLPASTFQSVQIYEYNERMEGNEQAPGTLFEEWQPFVLFSFVSVVVVVGTLDGSERGLTVRTRFRVAHAVAPSFADAKTTSGSGSRVVALSLHDRHACSACARTFAPGSPLSPAAVDRHGRFHYRHALLVLTPLGKQPNLTCH